MEGSGHFSHIEEAGFPLGASRDSTPTWPHQESRGEIVEFRATRQVLANLLSNPRRRAAAAVGFLTFWAIATHPSWYLSIQTLSAGDWGYLTPIQMRGYVALPLAWNRAGMGSLDYLNVAFYPFRLAYGLLTLLGVPFAISERILFFWPAGLLPLLGGYRLARNLKADRIPAIFAGLIYGTNTYLLIIETSQLTIVMAYGLAPFILSAFIRCLSGGGRIYALETALLLGLSAVFEPRITLITTAILVAWGGVVTVVEADPWQKGFWRRLGHRLVDPRTGSANSAADVPSSVLPGTAQATRKHFALPALDWVVVVIGASCILWAYWLLLIAVTRGSEALEILPTQPWISWMNIDHALLLSHPFWTGGAPANFTQQTPNPLFVILPLLAFSAPLVRRNREILLLCCVALVGAFLVKQGLPPFPDVYAWLFATVPGFDLYREASKFYLLVSLGFAPLIGVTLTEAWRWARRVSWPKRLSAVLASFLLVVVLLLQALPSGTGVLGGVYVPVTDPPEYAQVNQVLASNLSTSQFYRTFWWPQYERFGMVSDNMPALSGLTEVQTDMQFLLPDPTNGWTLFNNSETAPFFDLAAIRFVVVPYDPLADVYPTGMAPSFFLGEVDNVSWLRPLNLPNLRTNIFVNDRALPYVYGSVWTPSAILAASDLFGVEDSVRPLAFSLQSVGANLQVPVGVGIQSVILSERYDPNWRLTCANGYSALPTDLYGLTGFALQPNPTGSCTIGLTVQPWVVAGTLISAAGYTLAAVTLLVVVRRRMRPAAVGERACPAQTENHGPQEDRPPRGQEGPR